ncbi:hypothetical protein [Alteriqipengyuania sp.]|uniref:hypothetical protein n=1 Tax=Alteriqipengyuania sp. TaxID=2800692 RepID=UPI0035188E60
MSRWQAFWQRFLSPPTARFILALLALFFAAGGAFFLMSGRVQADNKDAAIFALGALFGLATNGFNYYFGSTARSDERPIETEIVNTPDDPVPVEDR